MRVGLSAGDLSTLADDARYAESLGFDDVACGEHAFFHGSVPNAFVALAAAAGATSTVRLVSAISLAPLYPAALFAKLVASLDVVSGGRFELGLGAGGEYPPEFEACGIDPATRFRRLEESVTVCRLLFGGGPVDFDGEFSHLHGVVLDPLPAQRPGPPIWMAGRKGKALERVGRLADVWLPYMVSPEMVADGLARVHASAAEEGRPPGSVSGAVFAWTCTDADGDWARRTGIDTVSAIYQQDFARLADRYLLVGTPAQIIERVGEYVAAGVERVIMAVAAGDADRRRVVETIAEDVLPALSKL
ncbi:MAG: LLM class flavin-dependent oxidoreductase [Acidimicrobiales bacterium]